MKKVIRLVKKRKESSQQSSGDDRSVGGGSGHGAVARSGSVSRASLASSATSSILQFQSPGSVKSVSESTKYNVGTNRGKDKSLTKLHVAVCREDIEKVRKYVKQGFNPDPAGGGTTPKKFKGTYLKKILF